MAVMLRVMGVRVFVVNQCVEPVVLVRRVRHFPDAAVRLYDRVTAVHHVPVAFLPLALVVLGVRVLDAVFVRVLGRSLRPFKRDSSEFADNKPETEMNKK